MFLDHTVTKRWQSCYTCGEAWDQTVNILWAKVQYSNMSHLNKDVLFIHYFKHTNCTYFSRNFIYVLLDESYITAKWKSESTANYILFNAVIHIILSVSVIKKKIKVAALLFDQTKFRSKLWNIWNPLSTLLTWYLLVKCKQKPLSSFSLSS